MWNSNREGDSWQQLPCSLCELQNLSLNVEKLHTFQKHMEGCVATVEKELLLDLSITMKASQYPQSISSRLNLKKVYSRATEFEAEILSL